MSNKTFRAALAATLICVAHATCSAAIVEAPFVQAATRTSELARATEAATREIASAERAAALSAFSPETTMVPRQVLQMLRGPSDVALWNLVATVHAQQKAKPFDLVSASATTVWEIEQRVSAVPLPGVVWLFVMALLGLAGQRLRPVAQGREQSAAQPQPA